MEGLGYLDPIALVIFHEDRTAYDNLFTVHSRIDLRMDSSSSMVRGNNHMYLSDDSERGTQWSLLVVNGISRNPVCPDRSGDRGSYRP